MLTGDGERDLCILYSRYDKGDMYLLPVSCTWYGYTYDDDEDDDMTRCKIHRDAALREARERGGLGRGKNCMAGTRVVRSYP